MYTKLCYPMFDFITIGSATRDVLLQTGDFESRAYPHSPTGLEQCFPLGSKLDIKEMVFATGGGGANAAVTFARQGWKVAAVGVVGKDFNGQEVIRELAEEGIETKYFQKHDDDYTAYSVILVNLSGERTILSYKGEGQHFNVAKIPFEQFKTKWFFLNSMGGNFPLLTSVIEFAAKHGIKMAMNPGGKELAYGLDKLSPVLKAMDIFITNREEGAQLLGSAEMDMAMVLEKMAIFRKGITVVTDGPQGAMVKDEQGQVYQAGVPDSPVVERTGAGDAWSSGFVSEYIRHGDMVKAMQFGTANASSVVTKFGAREGILKQNDWGPWPLVNVESIN